MVVHHDAEATRLESHAKRLLRQDGCRCLGHITHVHLIFDASEGEIGIVDVDLAVEQRVDIGRGRTERDDILGTVVNSLRRLNLETIALQHFGIEEQLAVLDQVEHQRLQGSTHHVHRDGVAGTLADQATSLDHASHIALWRVFVARLI